MTPFTVAPSLLCPYDFPGKNAGVGCHFLLQLLSLTSFKTILLDCILQLPYKHAFKKKFIEFEELFIVIVMLKTEEEKRNIFSVLYFIISRKVKMQLKCKRFM